MKNEIAVIPYIEHEYRMYKAYKREKRLKIMLTISNLIWLGIAVFLAVR